MCAGVIAALKPKATEPPRTESKSTGVQCQ